MPRDLPSPDAVRQLLRYVPKTGEFFWRERDGHENAAWNARWAGKPAGSIRADGYARIRILGILIFAHRIAWAYVHGEWPLFEIDHRNRKPSDNRIRNLRVATRHQNSGNMVSRGRSGVKGVYWDRGNQKWRAQIRANGKMKYLGIFDTVEKAKSAHDLAAKAIFGEFARIS
jgi:hypothetical protein